jgi:hypothetical protein
MKNLQIKGFRYAFIVGEFFYGMTLDGVAVIQDLAKLAKK